MRTILILNGLPGSGKGTQAEKIANRLGLVHISSGQLIRDAIANNDGSDFFQEIKKRYNRGQLQPDNVALKLVESRVASLQPDQGVIFDSFPINITQAKLLDSIINKYNFDQPTFIMLNITPDEALERLSKRRVCSNCGAPYINNKQETIMCAKCGQPLVTRSDDDVNVVRKRISEYLPLLKDLSAYYSDNGRFVEIDGQGDIDQVFKLISSKLNV